jgi:hypothetical protein
MVWVVIAMFFRTVSVSRSLAHYVAVARMVSDPRTDDVRDRLDHPNQQQDSSQHPQQPMRRRSSHRAGCRAFHPSSRKRAKAVGSFLFARVSARLPASPGDGLPQRYAIS